VPALNRLDDDAVTEKRVAAGEKSAGHLRGDSQIEESLRYRIEILLVVASEMHLREVAIRSLFDPELNGTIDGAQCPVPLADEPVARPEPENRVRFGDPELDVEDAVQAHAKHSILQRYANN
jgi:hypothetical protein